MIKMTREFRPAEPKAEPSAMSEKERLAQRAAVKATLAEWENLERDRQRCADACAANDAEADRIAAEHVADMEPVQGELRTLEEEAIQATMDRKPVDQNKEARRLQLIETIRLANATLAENLQRVRERQRAASEALMAATIKMGGRTINGDRNKLIGLGKPEWLDELFIAERTADLAASRVRTARRELAVAAGEEKRRWQIELTGAEAISRESQAEVEKIREKIINE